MKMCANPMLFRSEGVNIHIHVLTIRREFIEVCGSWTKTAETEQKKIKVMTKFFNRF